MPDIELASYQGQQEITEAINNLSLSSVPQKAVWFDNVASMVAYDLPVGVTAATRGYHTVNDGGSAFYYIREVAVGDVEDDGSIIFLSNGNVAELLPQNGVVNVKQFGAKGDGVTDDTQAIQNAIESAYTVVLGKAVYSVSSPIVVTRRKAIIGDEEKGATILNFTDDSDGCVKLTSNNITLKNITIQHLASVTSPIVDMSGTRYCTLVNVTTSVMGGTDCDAVGIYDNGSVWTGYNVFHNCVFSHYSYNVKIMNGTIYNFDDCQFTRASVANLYLVGEIFRFGGCVVANAPLCVEYHGDYIVAFDGCYLEGFTYGNGGDSNVTLAKVVSNSIGAGVLINGSKVMQTNVTKKRPGVSFSPSERQGYASGYHASVNRIVNGSFRFGTHGWNIIKSGMTYSMLTTDIPDNACCAIQLNYSDPSASKGFNSSTIALPAGTYTFNYWIKSSNAGGSIDIRIADADDDTNITRATLNDSNGFVSGEWWHLMYVFTIDEPKNVKVAGLVTGLNYVCLADFSVYNGVYSETDGNTCSEQQVLTEKLLVKGTDDKIYQISVNAGTITATEV